MVPKKMLQEPNEARTQHKNIEEEIKEDKMHENIRSQILEGVLSFVLTSDY